MCLRANYVGYLLTGYPEDTHHRKNQWPVQTTTRPVPPIKRERLKTLILIRFCHTLGRKAE